MHLWFGISPPKPFANIKRIIETTKRIKKNLINHGDGSDDHFEIIDYLCKRNMNEKTIKETLRKGERVTLECKRVDREKRRSP